MYKNLILSITLLFSASCTTFNLRAPSGKSDCCSSAEADMASQPTTPELFDILSWDVLRRTLEFLPEEDGSTVRSVSEDLCRVINDIPGHQPFMSLPSHPSEIWAAGFSPDSKTLATVCNNLIKIWRLNDDNGLWTCSNEMPNSNHLANALEFSPDGKTIVITSPENVDHNSGHIKILSFNEHTNHWISDIIYSVKCGPITFSPTNAMFVASSSQGGCIELCTQYAGKRWAKTRIRIPDCIYGTCCAKFSPDGQQILIGATHGRIYVFDCTSQALMSITLPCIQHGNVIDITFTSNGIQAITIDADDLEILPAKIWRFDETERAWICTREIDGDNNKMWYHAKFSDDGAQILSWKENGHTTRIWDLETGRIELEFKLPRGICRAALSPDEKWLIVGQSDGALRMYRMPNAEE